MFMKNSQEVRHIGQFCYDELNLVTFETLKYRGKLLIFHIFVETIDGQSGLDIVTSEKNLVARQRYL